MSLVRDVTLWRLLTCSVKGFGGAKAEKAAEVPEGPTVGISEEDKKWKLTLFDKEEWQVTVV